MTDNTHRDSGITTSSEVLAHYAKTALMYEELRAAIDDGHESMTHADALAEIAAIRAENAALQQGYDAAVDALNKAIAVIYSHPQVAAPAGEYPPLPTGSAWCDDDDVRDFGAGAGESALMFEPTQTQHVPLFTAGQMRAYVDADRAMRAAQPAGAQQPATAYAASVPVSGSAA